MQVIKRGGSRAAKPEAAATSPSKREASPKRGSVTRAEHSHAGAWSVLPPVDPAVAASDILSALVRQKNATELQAFVRNRTATLNARLQELTKLISTHGVEKAEAVSKPASTLNIIASPASGLALPSPARDEPRRSPPLPAARTHVQIPPPPPLTFNAPTAARLAAERLSPIEQLHADEATAASERDDSKRARDTAAAGAPLPAEPQPVPKAPIPMAATVAVAKPALPQSSTASADPLASSNETLRRRINSLLHKVSTAILAGDTPSNLEGKALPIFRDFDDRSSGIISRPDFDDALMLLGYDSEAGDVALLSQQFPGQGSAALPGSIDYGQLLDALKSGNVVAPVVPTISTLPPLPSNATSREAGEATTHPLLSSSSSQAAGGAAAAANPSLLATALTADSSLALHPTAGALTATSNAEKRTAVFATVEVPASTDTAKPASATAALSKAPSIENTVVDTVVVPEVRGDSDVAPLAGAGALDVTATDSNLDRLLISSTDTKTDAAVGPTVKNLLAAVPILQKPDATVSSSDNTTVRRLSMDALEAAARNVPSAATDAKPLEKPPQTLPERTRTTELLSRAQHNTPDTASATPTVTGSRRSSATHAEVEVIRSDDTHSDTAPAVGGHHMFTGPVFQAVTTLLDVNGTPTPVTILVPAVLSDSGSSRNAQVTNRQSGPIPEADGSYSQPSALSSRITGHVPHPAPRQPPSSLADTHTSLRRALREHSDIKGDMPALNPQFVDELEGLKHRYAPYRICCAWVCVIILTVALSHCCCCCVVADLLDCGMSVTVCRHPTPLPSQK